MASRTGLCRHPKERGPREAEGEFGGQCYPSVCSLFFMEPPRLHAVGRIYADDFIIVAARAR